MFKYYTGNMAIIIDQYGPIFMIYHNMCDGCMDRRDGWNYMCNSILPNHTRVIWKKELYFSYVLRGLLIICKNIFRVLRIYFFLPILWKSPSLQRWDRVMYWS